MCVCVCVCMCVLCYSNCGDDGDRILIFVVVIAHMAIRPLDMKLDASSFDGQGMALNVLICSLAMCFEKRLSLRGNKQTRPSSSAHWPGDWTHLLYAFRLMSECNAHVEM